MLPRLAVALLFFAGPLVAQDDGLGDLKVGQVYVVVTPDGSSVEETVTAVTEADVTLKLTRVVPPTEGGKAASPPETCERTIPRNVLAYLRKYWPKFALRAYGEQGYDKEYFESHIKNDALDREYMKERIARHETVKVSEAEYECDVYAKTEMWKTDHGCDQVDSEEYLSAKYPFLIRIVENGKDVLRLTEVRSGPR